MKIPNIVQRAVARKNLLVSVTTNRLLVLNETAKEVWSLLTRAPGKRESVIVKELARRYPSVARKQIATDVAALLGELEGAGFAAGSDPDLFPGENDRSTTGEGSHYSFSEEMHEAALASYTPVSGCFELTQRCHLKCAHCYIDDQPITAQQELTTGQVIGILDRLADQGCLWLLLTGGEPLLRRDFAQLYRHAKERGMIVTLFTSATNLTERIADVLAELPPFLVEATMHGPRAEVFDAITHIPGSFGKFCYGISMLRERGIPFHLKMIVMRQNLTEVEATRKAALKLGADDFRFDTMVNADFLHSEKARNLRVSVEDAIALDRLEPYRQRWKRIFKRALAERDFRTRHEGKLFPCRAGRCSFTVTADGLLIPCVLMRTPAFDLRRNTFRDAWHSLNQHIARLHMRPDNPCLRCSVTTCSRCPAWGNLEHNDPHAKSEFACSLQRERESSFLPIHRKESVS